MLSPPPPRDRARLLREREEAERGEGVTSMTRSGKARKKTTRRDMPRSTASQAVMGGAAIVRKSSKKINYEALQVL